MGSVDESLEQLSTEQLLIQYRRIKTGRGTEFANGLAKLEACLAEARRRDALEATPAMERVPDAFYPDGVVDGEGIRVDGRRIGSKVMGQTSWIVLPDGWLLTRPAADTNDSE